MAATPNPSNKGSTADAILDSAERLIQSRGYNAFSYNDIAAELEIRKASIHYHFPAKSDLGAAVLERYRARMEAEISAASDMAPGWDLLELYFQPYRQFAATPEKICLAGSLAGEYPALPEDIQNLVVRFITEHQAWLGDVLERGRASGAFTFDGPATVMAKLFFNGLQGSLVAKRATGDSAQLEGAIAGLRETLGC